MWNKLEKIFHKTVDKYQALHPRKKPSLEQLQQCKLISHRGEHDNKSVFENTLPAFDRVVTAGVWGIEFDIRWTKDLVPMVFHDKSCKRLFKKNIKINELTCHELQRELPSIPTLETVVNRYGTKTHLMVEIKKEDYPQPAKQSAILKEIFSKLTPIKDYHFITLHPEMFLFMTFVPSNTFLPIAITSYRRSSQLSLHKKYGGVLGHYQFLSKQRIKKHRLHGHKVGVGYVSSKNSLFREINRGVEWLFSNHALKMQEMLNKLIQEKRK